MSSNNNNRTPNTAASTGSQRSANSRGSVGTASRELFGSASKRPASLLKVKPSSAKRSKFNINKSPSSSRSTVPANNIPGFNPEFTLHVMKVVPNGVEQPICGAILLPTGYYMDRHLGNIMYARYSDNRNTKTFIDNTGAVHRCFECKIEGGDQLVKFNTSKASGNTASYPIKAIFIPMSPNEMETEEQLKAYVNDTFMPAFHNGILGTKNARVQDDQMPLLKDMAQVRTVTNWSDAFFSQEDICIIARMVLGADDVSLNDWIRHEDNNLYTLFHPGQIEGVTIDQFKLPMDKLHNDDKMNYTTFLADQKKANELETEAFLEDIAGKTELTPSEQRNLNSIMAERGIQHEHDERIGTEVGGATLLALEDTSTVDSKAEEPVVVPKKVSNGKAATRNKPGKKTKTAGKDKKTNKSTAVKTQVPLTQPSDSDTSDNDTDGDQ